MPTLQLIYQRCYGKFYEAGFGAEQQNPSRWRFYNEFLADWRHFFQIEGVRFPFEHDPRHTFACFRQIQRAFDITFRDIIGNSLPAARLRGAIWQSIFTHDMRRYRRTLYARMGEFATLITGPRGTGKELAARAIAESRYVPFDDRRLAFADDGEPIFFPINISALTPTLVESELFGHRRGAFTGAVADRRGWLETCPELGSVFLDELGDMDPAIQVKLLRVIETRTFHPVGDTAGRQFRGKLIAATNRDLPEAMRKGQFREDLYYRLCSDQIATVSMAEQLAASPGVLRELVIYMSRRVAGADGDDSGGRGDAVDRRAPRRRLSVAGKLSRAGAVREEHADPRQLSPGALCRDVGPGGRVRRPRARGKPDRRRTARPLCDDRVQPYRKLRRDGAPFGTRPPHREGEGGFSAARAPAAG